MVHVPCSFTSYFGVRIAWEHLASTCASADGAQVAGSRRQRLSAERSQKQLDDRHRRRTTVRHLHELLANELAEVLDDGDNLRVIPIVTYGAASNMDDLLYLRQVDIAMTQADVFEYFRTQRKIPNLEYRVNYIVRLPLSEVHILASADIKTIEDLYGKKVSFGPAGSASSI